MKYSLLKKKTQKFITSIVLRDTRYIVVVECCRPKTWPRCVQDTIIILMHVFVCVGVCVCQTPLKYNMIVFKYLLTTYWIPTFFFFFIYISNARQATLSVIVSVTFSQHLYWKLRNTFSTKKKKTSLTFRNFTVSERRFQHRPIELSSFPPRKNRKIVKIKIINSAKFNKISLKLFWRYRTLVTTIGESFEFYFYAQHFLRSLEIFEV